MNETGGGRGKGAGKTAGALNALAVGTRPAAPHPPPPLWPNQKAWRRFRRNQMAVISSWFLIVVVAFILLWPLFTSYEPDALSEAQFQLPSAQHWFGTDVHGRDLLVRVCY